MSVSNELSGEIAAALLTSKERSPAELHELKNMLIEVHATLQEMSGLERRRPIREEVRRSAEKARTASASE